jgi:putative endonuclease
MSPADRKALGQQGEDMACAFLEARGYAIKQRNFHCRYGEIDIVAVQAGQLVFVEVKARRTSCYGTPEEAVTAAKMQHIRQTALAYLQENNLPVDMRFDVIAIHWEAGKPVLNHIVGAF